MPHATGGVNALIGITKARERVIRWCAEVKRLFTGAV